MANKYITDKQKYVNKVIYDGTTYMDLTDATIEDSSYADKILSSYTAYAADGSKVAGTCTYDADTKDATASASEILSGKTAYKNGSKVTGTMNNKGAVTGTISTKSEEYTIPQGYHDGSGKVSISSTEQAKLVDTNIRQGVTILGVTGTMSGEEGVSAQSKTVTPTSSQQVITPDTGDNYNYLSQVTVLAIPYTEIANTTGITVTIGSTTNS